MVTRRPLTTASPALPKHTWTFKARFRREAYGWRASRLAIERIAEALLEIRQVARTDPVLAADGAVAFLERVSAALCQVDSSSGALGSAVRQAVDELALLIASAPATQALREAWLERLFDAILEDELPYIESLGDHWGALCASPQLASAWSDCLLPSVQSTLASRTSGTFAYFAGSDACFSALFAARRLTP